MLIIALSLPHTVMASDQPDHPSHTSKYRVEFLTPESSKLRLHGDGLRGLDPEVPLVATVRVTTAGYIPAGIEVRTWIGSFIFTANIPHDRLEQLEQDPGVVSIEPVHPLRSQ